jgi:hypothetical protein
MSLARRIDKIEREVRRNRVTVGGGGTQTQSMRGTSISFLGGSASGNGFFDPYTINNGSGNPTFLAFTEGFLCYAGTFFQVAPDVVATEFNGTSGLYYASLRIDYSQTEPLSGGLSYEMSAVDELPAGSDKFQHFALARVTVGNIADPGDPAVQAITNFERLWFGGWCIYDNRS